MTTPAPKSSRIQGMRNLSPAQRLERAGAAGGLDSDSIKALSGENALSLTLADGMIENVIGKFEIPMGVATNFTINGRDYLIPMAVEEPSVLAAVSFAAKLIRAGGGFTTTASDPIMIGQIQVLDIPDMAAAVTALQANRAPLMALADGSSQSIVRRGGGARSRGPGCRRRTVSRR